MPSLILGAALGQLQGKLNVGWRQQRYCWRGLFSNLGVISQGIGDRLDHRSQCCCLSNRRHEEDGLDGLFKLLRSEGMMRRSAGGYSYANRQRASRAGV